MPNDATIVGIWGSACDLYKVIREVQNKWILARPSTDSDLLTRAAIYLVHRMLTNGYRLDDFIAADDVRIIDAMADSVFLEIGREEIKARA